MRGTDNSYDDFQSEERKSRRDSYRVRRPNASRRRTSRKKSQAPGGMQQRRNKHWNW